MIKTCAEHKRCGDKQQKTVMCVHKKQSDKICGQLEKTMVFDIAAVAIIVGSLILYVWYFLWSSAMESERKDWERVCEIEKQIRGEYYADFIRGLDELEKVEDSELRLMPPARLEGYIKMVSNWCMYEKHGGSKTLNLSGLPIGAKSWDSIADAFEGFLISPYDDASIESLSVYLKDVFSGEVNTAFDVYYEYGLPEGFSSNTKFFAINFVKEYVHFISISGASYKVKATDITKTTLVNSRDKIKMRMKVNDRLLCGEIIIFFYRRDGGEDEDRIDFINWFNQKIQAQKASVQGSYKEVKLDKLKVMSKLKEVQGVTSKHEKIMRLHGLLETTLRELMEGCEGGLSELLDEASATGFYQEVSHLHQARKVRNRLAHGSDVAEQDVLDGIKSYTQGIEALLKD